MEQSWTTYIAIGASIIATIQFLMTIKSTFVRQKKNPQDVPSKASPENMKQPIVARVFDGLGNVVSCSPFSTKITAYLRLAGFPHTVKYADIQKAPKGKVPYIEHGSAEFGDSQLIIRYLENSYDVAKMAVAVAKEYGLSKPFVPYSKLSPQDQALSDAVRLICEHEVYWAVCGVRWAGDEGMGKSEACWKATEKGYLNKIPAAIRWILAPMIRVSFLRDAWGQGFLRHSPNDQLYLATRALRSLSNLLGNKPFFLGDFPAECDCIALGALENVLDDSQWPNDLTNVARKEFPNLVEYTSRVRKLIYPDMPIGDKRPQSKPNNGALIPKV